MLFGSSICGNTNTDGNFSKLASEEPAEIKIENFNIEPEPFQLETDNCAAWQNDANETRFNANNSSATTTTNSNSHPRIEFDASASNSDLDFEQFEKEIEHASTPTKTVPENVRNEHERKSSSLQVFVNKISLIFKSNSI